MSLTHRMSSLLSASWSLGVGVFLEQGGCHWQPRRKWWILGCGTRRRVERDGPIPTIDTTKSGAGNRNRRRAVAARRRYDWTTVTINPMEARMPPTRTHSASGATFTTALPVLWTCQAISQPFSSVHAIAFMSWRTTCSKVWQSQLWRIVIQGGASSVWAASRSAQPGAAVL